METQDTETIGGDGAPLEPGPTKTTKPTPDREPDYWGAGETLMRACITDAKNNAARLLRDRADILNLRFERGGRDNQWCVWDNGTSRYVPRSEDPEQGGLPAWVPRPVTNIYKTIINGLTAILDQSEPAQVYAPRTDSDEDQATADVAEDAVPVLREECGYDSEGHRHEINRAITMMDKVAYVLYYDDDPKYGMEDVEQFKCLACGLISHPIDIDEHGGCPECGNADTDEMFELATDEMGLPIGIPTPKGKICGEVVTSLEMSLPTSARRPHAKAVPWILLHNRMDPGDIETNWPKAKGIVHDKRNWADGPLTRAYADEMLRLSSPITNGTRDVVGGGAQPGSGPVVYRLQHDPIENDDYHFPDGFYGVMVADTLVWAGPLPFNNGDVQNPRTMKNIILRSWENGVANAHGHPPGDDQVPIQQSRNLTEAMIELIIMHDAAPTTFIPDTVTLIDDITGIPGDAVRYRSVNGEKPTQSRGMNPPEALFARLDALDQKAQEVSGLNAVLVGSRPEGDPTLGEIQILEERGMATFRNPLDGLVAFEKDLSFMLLAIARQSAWSPRFRRIRGDNGQWEIKQFAGADLTGSIDIVVNRASAWPRSPLMQQLRLKDALGMGVLPPPAQDPELQAKLLIDMNLAHLKPSYDLDRKQIARELEQWKAAHSPQEIAPPNPVTQNLQLHLYLKQAFLKTEDAEQLATANAMVYRAMLAHVQQLQMLLAPPPAPDPNAPPPKGTKGELDKALADGRLEPVAEDPAAGSASAPGAKGALESAIATGQLEPVEDTPAGAPLAPPAGGPSIDDLSAATQAQPVLPPEDPSGMSGVPV